jgi:hypothetical protein
MGIRLTKGRTCNDSCWRTAHLCQETFPDRRHQTIKTFAPIDRRLKRDWNVQASRLKSGKREIRPDDWCWACSGPRWRESECQHETNSDRVPVEYRMNSWCTHTTYSESGVSSLATEHGRIRVGGCQHETNSDRVPVEYRMNSRCTHTTYSESGVSSLATAQHGRMRVGGCQHETNSDRVPGEYRMNSWCTHTTYSESGVSSLATAQHGRIRVGCLFSSVLSLSFFCQSSLRTRQVFVEMVS